jgi:hypothetical protein
MYEKYKEIGDPTEYQTALVLLGSWRHWEHLTGCEWFKEHVTRWRNELAVKMESDRCQEMLEVKETHKGTPQGVAATKWLADRYTKPVKHTRGRPSLAEKKKHLDEISKEDQLLKEEAERLGM